MRKAAPSMAPFAKFFLLTGFDDNLDLLKVQDQSVHYKDEQ